MLMANATNARYVQSLLPHHKLLPVLDEDALGGIAHTLAVQVVNGLVVSGHSPVHDLPDAARVTICQGNDVHEAVPWRGALVVADRFGRNV